MDKETDEAKCVGRGANWVGVKFFQGSFWGSVIFDIFSNGLSMKSESVLVKYRWKALPVFRKPEFVFWNNQAKII